MSSVNPHPYQRTTYLTRRRPLICQNNLPAAYLPVVFALCAARLASPALRVFASAVCFVSRCISSRLCLVLAFDACAMRSAETVLETPYAAMVTILVRTFKMQYSRGVRRRNILYVLFTKASANDFVVVAEGSVSTTT